MAFGQGLKTTDLDFILDSVGEFNILSHYLGISKIPCIIKSPLRVDNNPSFSLYSKDGIRIYYHDFATRDRGGTIQLLMKLWNVDYATVLQMLTKDLSKIPLQKSNIQILKDHKANIKSYNHNILLECKVRSWKAHDLEYWEEYGITKEWLIFSETFPISHIILTKEGNRYTIPSDKYAYAYVERKDSIISLKIYQPFNERYKWMNKHDGSVWDLWTKLPDKGDNLIITSSRKDALCIWANTEIPSLSLQAESYLPKQHVVQQLKDRFKNVYVLYDNDFDSSENHGRELGNLMAKEFDLIQIEIPDEYKSKDTSDLYKNYGKKEVQNIIYKLIKIV